jgi:signal peptidase I
MIHGQARGIETCKMHRIPKKLIVLGPIIVCLGLTLTVYRLFFVWMVRVPTGSMMNTILPGDHIVVNRTLGEIRRGTVVMFQYPSDSARYISRVVGLPGETIQLQARAVYINGQELPEERVIVRADYSTIVDEFEEISVESAGPYRVYYSHHADQQSAVPEDVDPNTFGIATPFRIADGEYFLLGDNRDNSQDSRYRGSVPRSLIWGTASLVYWSSFRDNAREEHVRTDRLWKKIR